MFKYVGIILDKDLKKSSTRATLSINISTSAKMNETFEIFAASANLFSWQHGLEGRVTARVTVRVGLIRATNHI